MNADTKKKITDYIEHQKVEAGRCCEPCFVTANQAGQPNGYMERCAEFGHSLALRDAEVLVEALEGILANLALDWYVQQFSKDETPSGISSGIIAKVHNVETLHRIRSALENSREALERWKKVID